VHGACPHYKADDGLEELPEDASRFRGSIGTAANNRQQNSILDEDLPSVKSPPLAYYRDADAESPNQQGG
jgi:hypothetical protein